MTVLAPTDESECLRLPHFAADSHAPPAQDAVLVFEGKTYVRNATLDGQILYGTRVRGFRDEHLRDDAPGLEHFLGMGQNYHAFFRLKRAGGGHSRPSVLDQLDDTYSAYPYRFHTRHVT